MSCLDLVAHDLGTDVNHESIHPPQIMLGCEAHGERFVLFEEVVHVRARVGDRLHLRINRSASHTQETSNLSTTHQTVTSHGQQIPRTSKSLGGVRQYKTLKMK